MIKLTPRELEVLELLNEGFTSKEMAKELGRGVRTICFHRGNLLLKFGVHNSLKLVMVARSEGFIT